MVTAILLSAILSFLLGFLWYSPKMFGNVWLDAIDKKPGDIEDSNAARHAISIIGWLASSFVYALLINNPIFQSGVQDYLFLSIALWGAFMMPAKAGAIMHGGFNTKLLWIDGGYHLAGYLIFALVFGFLV